MTDREIAYFGPRVMRHDLGTRGEEFAIHEVYFDEEGRVVTCTEDALSPRCFSVEQLRSAIARLLEGNTEEIVAGDLGYEYDREYVEDWLRSIEDPPVEYR